MHLRKINHDNKILFSHTKFVLVLKSGKIVAPLDPVYTVPDPQGHDIKLNTFKTSVTLKFMIILQNLLTKTNHRKW